MLKGHVFSKQLFGNPIFALFINTFLNGKNGVSNNFKNGMNITYSSSIVTIDSGAVCIQGRFLEEDTSTQIDVGTEETFCKLVIEINLDKDNTETDFIQGSYKIVKGTVTYPTLTQTNIVKNNAGIYQYELARFKTGITGITDFQDMRTFLDYNSIYDEITAEYRNILLQLQQELENVQDASAYVFKDDFVIIEGQILVSEGNAITDIPYPQGLTKENTIFISLGVTLIDSEYHYIHTMGSMINGVTMYDSKIGIKINNIVTGGTTKSLNYKLTLMKLEDQVQWESS